MVLAHVPCSCNERSQQPAREYSASLQRIDTEDLTNMRGVIAPLIDDVQNLRADDAAQHDQNAEIPGVVAVVTEAFRITDADPKPQQHAKRDQESVCRKEETSVVKELWEHCCIRCWKDEIATEQSSGRSWV